MSYFLGEATEDLIDSGGRKKEKGCRGGEKERNSKIFHLKLKFDAKLEKNTF